MSAGEVELARVRSVVARILRAECGIDVPDLKPEARFAEDLGMDSVKLLTLATELENHYQMRLEEDVENPPQTVRELVSLVAQRLADRDEEDPPVE